MDKQFILEGNRLIADYMGVEWRGKQIVIPPTNVLGEEVSMEPKVINHDETLSYHCSYCSLMPVVEKLIMDDVYFELQSKCTGLSKNFRFVQVGPSCKWFTNNNKLVEEIWSMIVHFLNEKQHNNE